MQEFDFIAFHKNISIFSTESANELLLLYFYYQAANHTPQHE